MLIHQLGGRLRFGRVLSAQIAGEASTIGLPMGFLVGESVRPWLLSAGTPLGIGRALAVVMGRKFLLVLTQGLLIVTCSLLAFRQALGLSTSLTGGPWLWLVGLAFGLLLLGAAALLPLTLGGGRRVHALFGWLQRTVPNRLRNRLIQKERHFLSTDRELVALFQLPARALARPAALIFVGVWALEGLEVWLILRLLGVPIDLGTAMYVEAVVALSRSVLPLAPAGLGIQDAGYVAFFSGLGMGDGVSVGAAFCLVKRGREALWCLIGAACFVALRKRQRPGSARNELLP